MHVIKMRVASTMPDTFSLKNFEGPIELLLLLVQKEEVDIIEIALHVLTQQLLAKVETSQELNQHADQLAIIARLLSVKSHKLIPQKEEREEEEDETTITLIEQLLEQCEFREIAEALQERERQSHVHFTRMLPPPTKNTLPEQHGLEEITLNQLRQLFEAVYREAAKNIPISIKGQRWEVREKIEIILTLLTQQKECSFAMLFEKNTPREELIVIFLAVLELLKRGNITLIMKENELKFAKNKELEK
jgi:segregation and condensation protein A